MGLYKPTDQLGQPLNIVYAEDILQLVNVLSGQQDGGALSLLQPLAAPAAPSVSLSAGGITGTGYQWGVYWVSGIMDGTATAHVTGRTPVGTLTSAQALSAQEATVSISSLTPPTGTIGWGVARNKSGGSTWYLVPGSEQYLTVAGSLPASYIDNTVDASLVTVAQTANTTGTTFPGVPVAYGKRTSNVSSSGTSFGTGADILAAALPFNANGTSDYMVRLSCEYVTQNTNNDGAFFHINLDGSDAGLMRIVTVAAAAAAYSGDVTGVLVAPSAGAHTLNVRLRVDAGSATIQGGAGGSGAVVPILVSLQRMT